MVPHPPPIVDADEELCWACDSAPRVDARHCQSCIEAEGLLFIESWHEALRQECGL